MRLMMISYVSLYLTWYMCMHSGGKSEKNLVIWHFSDSNPQHFLFTKWFESHQRHFLHIFSDDLENVNVNYQKVWILTNVIFERKLNFEKKGEFWQMKFLKENWIFKIMWILVEMWILTNVNFGKDLNFDKCEFW